MPRHHTRSANIQPSAPFISKYSLRKRTPVEPKVLAILAVKKAPLKTKKIKKPTKKIATPKTKNTIKNSTKSTKKQPNPKKDKKSIERTKSKRSTSSKSTLRRQSSRLKELKQIQSRPLRLSKATKNTKITAQDRSISTTKITKSSNNRLKAYFATPSQSLKRKKPKSMKKDKKAQPRKDIRSKKLTKQSEMPVINVLPPPRQRKIARRSMSPEQKDISQQISSTRRSAFAAQLPKRVRNSGPAWRIKVEEDPIDDIVVTDNKDGESLSRDNPVRFKTIAELERIKRGRQQRIYLLSAQKEESNEWKFKVFGTKGQIYTTRLHMAVRCSCFDFRSNKKPCKHVYFIILQIAQNDKILQAFNQGQISEEAFAELDLSLTHRLKARMQGNKPADEQREIDLKDDQDCVICFTEMNKTEESLADCSTCQKYFHSECLRRWRQLNNTCPLCRSEFKVKLEEADPLSKFEELRI